jgi:hypothetical protein
MGRNTRRKTPRPPRKCIFCGGGGIHGNPMSEEHLWPEWMHPYLPTLPDPEKQEGYQVIRMGTIVSERRMSIRQGHTYTRKFKVVCKRCNETWMGDIEEDTKPILIPFVQGSPMTLLRNHRIKLARWLALKTMVIEQENPKDAVLQEDARAGFMDTQNIPREIRAWLFTHDDTDWYASFWHQTLIASFTPDHPPATGRLKNVQTTALGVGHLFAFMIVTTLPGANFKLNQELRYFTRQLWPLRPEPIAWPLPRFPAVDRLAHHLSELMRSPIAAWRPLP